jgi:hypothetical protein
MNELLAPQKVWSRLELLAKPCPIPRLAGVYAWYFREVPAGVPTAGCLTFGGLTLLYVGISPKAPPRNGKPPSSQTLYDRIRYHYTGNAAGSTLRLTLGCLLPGVELRRVGRSGDRLHFADDERRVSAWMEQNALVTWVATPEPWKLEEELIQAVSLPLNLDQNRNHPFHAALSATRKEAKRKARSLPVVPGY